MPGYEAQEFLALDEAALADFHGDEIASVEDSVQRRPRDAQGGERLVDGQ